MRKEFSKDLLFSVTKNDFKFDYFRGTGNGGQKKNKTSSAVRCHHADSGAVAECEETRSQSENRERAWFKCVNTPAFQNWLRIAYYKELDRKNGLEQISDRVEREMSPENLKIEIKRDGKWVEVDFNDLQKVACEPIDEF